MDIFKIFRKCILCDCVQEKEKLLRVHKHGIYGELEEFVYYHDKCLKSVLLYPYSFGHKKTDEALKIADLLIAEKDVEDKERKEFESKKAKADAAILRLYPELIPPLGTQGPITPEPVSDPNSCEE